MTDIPGLVRQGLIQAVVDQNIYLTEAAQGAADQVAGEGPIAGGQRGKTGIVLQGIIQGSFFDQYGLEKVKCGGSGHGRRTGFPIAWGEILA